MVRFFDLCLLALRASACVFLLNLDVAVSVFMIGICVWWICVDVESSEDLSDASELHFPRFALTMK